MPHSTSLYHYTYWQIYTIRVPGVLSPGGRATEAWSGPLTSIGAEFKNKWSYTSTPLILLHGLDRYSYTFFFKS